MTHESTTPLNNEGEGRESGEATEGAPTREREARRGGRRSREHAHEHSHDHDGEHRGRGERGGRAHRHPGGPGRGRRGDIRAAILIALQDDPAHGYELMQSLAERSGGRWRPSPGSIYPTLQMLEDEGLLSSEEIGGKRVFTLTDSGISEAQTRTHDAGDVMPWERPDDRDESPSLRDAVKLFELAARQASLTRDDALVAKVTDIVTAARKSIYQLLAE